MRGLTVIATSLLALASSALAKQQKIYGVNLGSWLVLEPWLLPQEWKDMGGETCDDCSQCIMTESAFAKAYPDTVDAQFDKHWTTWFTKSDAKKLKELGINTVRIPLGYWLVEPLVDRPTEAYPRGGMRRLKQGLSWLKDAGIDVILDHHAAPGSQSVQQTFAGECTKTPKFYTPYNYHRALIWTAVMTTFSHLDPDFATVYAIEAVNEPIMDATQTPDYGMFQKEFVQVLRAVELTLGIVSPLDIDLDININIDTAGNLTSALGSVVEALSIEANVASALADAIPVLTKMVEEYGDNSMLSGWHKPQRTPLTATFMDVNWQYNNPANPAHAKIGSALYDNHLYYSFGGVADATEQAYMESICNLTRVEVDAAVGNSPLVFGEWGLPTQFNATDEFLHKWADAQKLMYSRGAGWIFWNFKAETSELAGDVGRQWSYMEGVERGYLTKDPSKYNDIHVCEPYINSTSSA